MSRCILCCSRRRRPTQSPWDVFINHRGIDTKRSLAVLLYDHLNLHPFMDIKSMNPGDKLFQTIDNAIRNCKVGVSIFSPHYCESSFCLRELTTLMESKKKIIPIFVDVKPSELRVIDNGSFRVKELPRFRWALDEAKYTVGFSFDSSNGDWSDLVTRVSNVVMESLIQECPVWQDGHHNLVFLKNQGRK
ncbi:hypothetical protein HHK36_012495 [Tetracentron sinense]|uniref:TIR domain-containing protein n=1 Tax=Tetracentron sinense TaxID=13715 RepID=A0A835DEL9_TETSI|nr:hypothetical protein HHK36_012495 [Tetracentron sinense]